MDEHQERQDNAEEHQRYAQIEKKLRVFHKIIFLNREERKSKKNLAFFAVNY